MKTLKLTTIILTAFLFFFAACEKEKVTTVTNTVTVHDTLTTPALTRTETLTAKTWQIDEVEISANGTNTSYVRGGTNTTGITYDNIKIQFNSDGSGTYTDELSGAHSMTWVFTSADQRSATLTVAAPNPAIFYWRMIELKDNYLHCTAPYNSNSMIAARYIQVP